MDAENFVSNHPRIQGMFWNLNPYASQPKNHNSLSQLLCCHTVGNTLVT